ncbi:MAG: mechanosensitive ion channel family protein [Agriterribacter sp.]
MTATEVLHFSIYIGCGIVLGFLIQKLLMPFLEKMATRSKWAGDDLIISSISKWIMPWFIALGIFLGWREVPMQEKYHHWLENSLLIFYIFSVTWILARVFAGLTMIKAKDSEKVAASSSIVGNIIKVIVYCIGLLVILQSLGLEIGPVLTALGVGGLAVALALQDTLSNLFAGIQIISTKKINPGDYIRLDSGQEGVVEDVSWRYTTVRTGVNNIFIVPNSKLAGLIVSNFYYPDKEFVFDTLIGVDYSSDLDKVERVTIEVIKALQEDMEECVPNFDPFIRYQQFADSSITLKAFIKVTEFTNQFKVKHEFIKRLQKKYQEEGIKIPFPMRNIYINNPDPK